MKLRTCTLQIAPHLPLPLGAPHVLVCPSYGPPSANFECSLFCGGAPCTTPDVHLRGAPHSWCRRIAALAHLRLHVLAFACARLYTCSPLHVLAFPSTFSTPNITERIPFRNAAWLATASAKKVDAHSLTPPSATPTHSTSSSDELKPRHLPRPPQPKPRHRPRPTCQRTRWHLPRWSALLIRSRGGVRCLCVSPERCAPRSATRCGPNMLRKSGTGTGSGSVRSEGWGRKRRHCWALHMPHLLHTPKVSYNLHSSGGRFGSASPRTLKVRPKLVTHHQRWKHNGHRCAHYKVRCWCSATAVAPPALPLTVMACTVQAVVLEIGTGGAVSLICKKGA